MTWQTYEDEKSIQTTMSDILDVKGFDENKFVAAILSSSWSQPPGNIRLVSVHMWLSQLWWWEEALLPLDLVGEGQRGF